MVKLRCLYSVAIAVVCLAASPVFAAPFDGPYVGIAGQYVSFNQHSNFNYPHFETEDDFRPQLFGGYGKTFGNYYLGLEWDASLNADGGNNRVNVPVDRNLFYEWKNKYTYGASLKPGYIIDNDTLLYLKVGVERGAFRYKSGNTSANFGGLDTLSNNNQTLTGVALGLGGAFAITPQILARMEWAYTAYEKGDSFVGNGIPKASPDSNTFALGVSYGF